MSSGPLQFVTALEMQVEPSPWGPHEWLSRPGLTEARELLLVRVRMPPGRAHQFHRHPAMEEIIYVLSGTAEQWVDRERRTLGAGDIAHIPRDVVHGTYNCGSDPLVFLAILSPAGATGAPPSRQCRREPGFSSARSGRSAASPACWVSGEAAGPP